jgi:Intracellular proteinase inhibitor
VAALAVVAVLSQTLVGAHAQEEDPPRCTRDDISLDFDLGKRSYAHKRPVAMRLAVENVSGEACTMRWPYAKYASFLVYDGDRQIWESGHCRVYTQQVVEERWEDGHREVYRGKWRQWKNGRPPLEDHTDCTRGGGRAEPGRYTARARFEGAREKLSGVKRFRIKG